MSERNVIELQPNEPQLVTLEFDSPLEGSNRNGTYFAYKCNSGEDILFVPEAGKLAIDRSGAKRGDTISLTKAKNGNRNLWTAELAKQEPARSSSLQREAAARPSSAPPQSRGNGWPAEETPQPPAKAQHQPAKEESRTQSARPNDAPSQSWPLAEQLLPFLRGAIIATSQAENEAKQNGIQIHFDTGDVRSLAITLYIESRKAAR